VFLAVCLLAGLGAGVILYQPLWAFDLLAHFYPRIVWRVSTRAPLVALTFDDGPDPIHTSQVLDILARHRAHATFFLIGERAAKQPDLVSQIRRAGHDVGNHSYTIHSMQHASDEVFLRNLLQTEDELMLHSPSKLYRPPGGIVRASQLDLAAAHGYRCILGSAYPYDPAHPPAGYIRWLVSKNLAPGVIVILHDGIPDPSRSIAALDGILAAGEQKGLHFVTVGELIQSREAGP
jgi:peptidoglycan/xylan/chitin deacetylase (PgdA/CDA1 family)